MDPNTLQQQAMAASNDVGRLQSSAPTLISELKKNLVSIYAKDNPVMQARDAALSDFLSTPARARADMLPTNMAQIEGRNLTLSPTQQNAITTSRSSAALAPLMGLNQIVQAGYGNIGDIIGNAATLYENEIGAAKTRADSLMDFYKESMADRRASASNAGMGDSLAAILAQLNAVNNTPGITDMDVLLDQIYASDERQAEYDKTIAEPDYVYSGRITPADKIKDFFNNIKTTIPLKKGSFPVVPDTSFSKKSIKA